MENPYEEAGTVILTRIIGNVVSGTAVARGNKKDIDGRAGIQEKLSEGMLALNKAIIQTNVYNSSVSEVVELWTNYLRNMRFNLESAQALEDPL